jgi:hypothetical protein
VTERTIDTPAGTLAGMVDPGQVWRIGYQPQPWAWSSWEYATNGRFNGRWDDPAGMFRTVYAGDSLLTCLLEVLSAFRPDPLTEESLAEIVEDAKDAVDYPTLSPGSVSVSGWLAPRAATTATLDGVYCGVLDKVSLPTLRSRFLPLALRLGFVDLDAGSLRVGAPAAAAPGVINPRVLTQAIANWLYELNDQSWPLFDGLQFESRHGDGLKLWAIFEQPRDGPTSKRLRHISPVRLDSDHPALTEAFRLHNLHWVD